MAFKIFRFNCCGLDVHKTWIFACIGLTDANGRTEYKEKRFSSFSRGLRDLAAWLASYNCTDVCMESAGKYWIPVFNYLESDIHVCLTHPKYVRAIKGRKTDKKEGSYTTYLFEKGLDKILKKVGEECTEVIIAAKGNSKEDT